MFKLKNMVTVHEIRNSQCSGGGATILALGNATPNCINQADYPCYYFRVTNCERMTDLKQKCKRMCEKSMIKKRYLHLTEEFLKENPNICTHVAPFLDVRQDITMVEVPKLGKEAAVKAIEEWGQPNSNITHLIFYTSCSVDMAGADYRLTKLLGLLPSVRRLMMYQQGCYAGSTVLRISKDLAENNKGARELVVCSEITAVCFRSPFSDARHLGALLDEALFGDGAAEMIIGADPDTSIGEHPIFQLVSAAQTLLQDSEVAVEGHLREAGLMVQLLKTLPGFISENIEKSLAEAMAPMGISGWNSVIWVVHPGGWGVLDKVEGKLGLEQEKLEATRKVLSEHGNMWSTSVLFVLDEMRKKAMREGKATTGGRIVMGSPVRVWAGCDGGDGCSAQRSGA